MYAVVQIGSMILRSECITTRSVVSAETDAGAAPASATDSATHATSSALVRLIGRLLARSTSSVGDKTTDGAKLSTHRVAAGGGWWANRHDNAANEGEHRSAASAAPRPRAARRVRLPGQ